MLDKEVIVIVGAGCIGLCTAYNLSKTLSLQGAEYDIIVVDASDRPFPAASSACTGCFHYYFPGPLSKPLEPLGKYSFDLWAKEAEHIDFRLTTGYRSNSSYGILEGDGKGLDKLPNWVKPDASWNVDTKVLGDSTATVYVLQNSPSSEVASFKLTGLTLTSRNPNGLCEWLVQQCLARGVGIRTNSEVIDVKLSALNELRAVTLKIKGQGKTTISCKQLLLACGPWTPTLYEQLFPSAPVHLQWTTNAGDWITCNNPCLTTLYSTAFVSFEPLIGEKFEFAGRNDGTIWACGRRNLDASLPLPGQNGSPDVCFIQEMRKRARQWLNWHCACAERHEDDVQILNQGRAFRPMSKSGLPVISPVLSSDISPNTASHRTGIFVCWGHGSWGLTLGMGSGRLMSQLMCGETPDLDLSAFSLEQNTILQDEPWM